MSAPAARLAILVLAGVLLAASLLAARGLRHAEVAERLSLTPHMVGGNVKPVHARPGISNRAEAARRTARLGLTQL